MLGGEESMSIYPVKINSWFKDDENMGTVKEIIKHLECKVCGKKANTRGYVYHAMPHGFATNEYWCSLKCLKGKST